MRTLCRAAAVLFLIAASACGDDDEPTRVYLFGDSLVAEASQYWLDLMDDSDRWEARESSLPGTATCDFFDLLRETRDEFRPEVVAISFSGNAIGPCMLAADGSALSSEEYEEKYRADTEKVIELLGDDVHVYLVGAPVSGTPDERVFDIYRDLAKQHPNATFVDGGRIVSPNRTFVETLPCLPDEPCTGPVVDGVPSNMVRAADRAHFCPVEPVWGEPCSDYSPGAYRFALTIYEAIRDGEE